MSNPTRLQEKAKEHAIKAVDLDKSGRYESAIFYYLVNLSALYFLGPVQLSQLNIIIFKKEASQALIDLKSVEEASFNLSLQTKLNDYITRAETLKLHIKHQQQPAGTSGKSHAHSEIQISLSMLREALDHDQETNLKEAFDLYTNAIQVYIKIVSVFLFRYINVNN